MKAKFSLTQRALELHRRSTDLSLDDALFVAACEHSIRFGEVPPSEHAKVWAPNAPNHRMTGFERGQNVR